MPYAQHAPSVANKRSSSAATTFTTKLGRTYVDKGYQQDFLFELPPGEGVCFIEESYGASYSQR